jgi:hypothetical protein
MAKTLIFSKPVEKRLKELKLKTIISKRIYSRWKQEKFDYEKRQMIYKRLKSYDCLLSLLLSAFRWADTPEGKQYWIDLEQEEELKELKERKR